MDLITKFFTSFDFLGYIVIGFLQSLLFKVLYRIILNENLADVIEMPFSLSYLIVYFTIGKLIQSISNIFSNAETEKKRSGPQDLQFLHSKAIEFFGLPLDASTLIIWELVYLRVLNSDYSSVSTFMTSYFLYRGLKTVSLASSFLAFLVILATYIQVPLYFTSEQKFRLIIYFISTFVASQLFAKRAARMWNYAANKTYCSFYLLECSVPPNKPY